MVLAAEIDITVVDVIVYVITAVVGGLPWAAIFPGNDGIAWIGSIIVAVLLLILYGQFLRARSTRFDALVETPMPVASVRLRFDGSWLREA